MKRIGDAIAMSGKNDRLISSASDLSQDHGEAARLELSVDIRFSFSVGLLIHFGECAGKKSKRPMDYGKVNRHALNRFARFAIKNRDDTSPADSPLEISRKKQQAGCLQLQCRLISLFTRRPFFLRHGGLVQCARSL